MKGKKKNMKLSTNKTTKSVITMILMFAITFSLFIAAAPVAAQAGPSLTMNLPGSEGVLDAILLGEPSFDIDLNGGPGAGNNLELWVKWPGRSVFTYVDTYPTRSNGDLDVYDDGTILNETGIYAMKWVYPDPPNAESNVESVAVYARLEDMPPAHDPPWQIYSYPYLCPAPNPVGVGQKVLIVMWVDEPLPSANVNNDIRRVDYSLTITKPDKTTETVHWDIVGDTTSIQYYSYTPTQVGPYTLLFEYGGQTYEWMGSYFKDVFLPCEKTVTLNVQQEPLPPAINSYPLPTEYWTRPIEGQNTDWWSISSNWLSAPYIEGAGDTYGTQGSFQPDGLAPNSAHVMWSRPIQDGGVVGGSGYHVEGTTYYMGGSYNMRFGNPLIMHGRLYYELPLGNSGGGGGWICVDLQTGEEIWYNPDIGASGTGLSDPRFGYLYDYDMYNQHGVVPSGWLFANNFGDAYDPLTGKPIRLTIENVPSGTQVIGPQGEILRISWSNSRRDLAQWNSSKVFTTSSSSTYDASSESNYDWRVEIPNVGPGSWSLNRASYNNILLLTQGSFGDRGQTLGANITAISLKPASRGQILWTMHYPVAENNAARSITAWDPDNGVFVMRDKEPLTLRGFSLETGRLLWGPTVPMEDYAYFRTNTHVAYGKIYSASYGGVLYCYDSKSGDLLWTYGNGGEGNSTFSGLATAWGRYPVFVDVIADDKVYLATTEHSPGSPFYKDTKYRCVNATDGTEIWTLMGWGTGMDPGCDVVADGFFVFLNCYDMQVYAVGKGPSALTVEAPMTSNDFGKPLVIRGSVTDIAAGTEQFVVAKRFPNGVPAVSDESMGTWMEYVYMQKPKPLDAVGVTVSIDVVDSNGNYRNIGTTTSDSSGMFSLTWTPDIEGSYYAVATFAGSDSYWPSSAETSFVVDSPQATPSPYPQVSIPPTEMYIIGTGLAIIVAIAIAALLILKKRP